LKLFWWFEVESREVSGLALVWFVRPLIGPLSSPAASEHHHHSQQHHTMGNRQFMGLAHASKSYRRLKCLQVYKLRD
jgi:hypothetical protein